MEYNNAQDKSMGDSITSALFTFKYKKKKTADNIFQTSVLLFCFKFEYKYY